MATKLYLPASGTPPLASLAFSADWERSNGAVRLPCSTVKGSTALATTTLTWGGTTTVQWIWKQFQSPTLQVGYDWTTADTVSMVIGKCAETTTSGDTHLAYLVKIVSEDGSVVRGVIGLFHATSSEFPLVASAATRIHNARTSGATAFSSLPGDRIVIEIGVHGVTPAAESIQMRFGESAASDFALTAGLTTDLNPWVELSRTVVFGPPARSGIAVVSGNGSQIGNGQKGGRCAAVASAAGALLALGFAGMLGVASLSGGGAATAAARKDARGVVSVSARGAVAAVGEKAASATALVFGDGLLTATGTKWESEQHFGIAVISGNGTTTAGGLKTAQTSCFVSTDGSVTSSGWKAASSPLVVSAGGAASAQGQKAATSIFVVSGGGAAIPQGSKAASSAASITETGLLGGIGHKNAASDASVSAGGALGGTGARTAFGDLAISGGGSVVASGVPGVAEEHFGIASTSGNGLVSSGGSKGALGSMTITSSGEILGWGHAGEILSVDQVGHVEIGDRPEATVLCGDVRRDSVELAIEAAVPEVENGQLL